MDRIDLTQSYIFAIGLQVENSSRGIQKGCILVNNRVTFFLEISIINLDLNSQLETPSYLCKFFAIQPKHRIE